MKMASRVPSGRTRIFGTASTANGPAASMTTESDQVAPPSIVRENLTVLGARKSNRKFAQAAYACPASAGLPVIESWSLP
jgi:hypothetical protein